MPNYNDSNQNLSDSKTFCKKKKKNYLILKWLEKKKKNGVSKINKGRRQMYYGIKEKKKNYVY